jgi:hypothetical protein
LCDTVTERSKGICAFGDLDKALEKSCFFDESTETVDERTNADAALVPQFTARMNRLNRIRQRVTASRFATLPGPC